MDESLFKEMISNTIVEIVVALQEIFNSIVADLIRRDLEANYIVLGSIF